MIHIRLKEYFWKNNYDIIMQNNFFFEKAFYRLFVLLIYIIDFYLSKKLHVNV